MANLHGHTKTGSRRATQTLAERRGDGVARTQTEVRAMTAKIEEHSALVSPGVHHIGDYNVSLAWSHPFHMPERSHDGGDRISNGWPCPATI